MGNDKAAFAATVILFFPPVLVRFLSAGDLYTTSYHSRFRPADSM